MYIRVAKVYVGVLWGCKRIMEKTIETYVLGLGWSRSSTQIHEKAGSHCQEAFPCL